MIIYTSKMRSFKFFGRHSGVRSIYGSYARIIVYNNTRKKQTAYVLTTRYPKMYYQGY